MKNKKILLFIVVFLAMVFGCCEIYANDVDYDYIMDDSEPKKVVVCKYDNIQLTNYIYDDIRQNFFEVLKDGVGWSDFNMEFDFNPQSESECPESLYFDSKSKNLYSSRDNVNKVSCGHNDGMITRIPKKLPKLTSYAFTIIQVSVPVILILMGSIDLFKGITAQKEDEIKKGQQLLIKRLIAGVLIFLIIIIVKFIISIVAGASTSNIVDCMDCFLNDSCEIDGRIKLN